MNLYTLRLTPEVWGEDTAGRIKSRHPKELSHPVVGTSWGPAASLRHTVRDCMTAEGKGTVVYREQG